MPRDPSTSATMAIDTASISGCGQSRNPRAGEETSSAAAVRRDQTGASARSRMDAIAIANSTALVSGPALSTLAPSARRTRRAGIMARG